MQTATTEAAANALFQAQRTGCQVAITLAERQQAAARFRARNRQANDYANQLAADYARLTPAERAAEAAHQASNYHAATL